MSNNISVSVLLLFLLLQPVQIQAKGDASIIIENVLIMDKAGQEIDETVNIFINSGNLEIVTRDELPDQPEVIRYDAKDAVLIGMLNVGDPATFLLLNESPRENADILLDTKSHAIFGIARGEIRRNRLLRAGTKPKKPQGWFAYTPPPFALLLNAESARKWNHFNWDKASMIFAAALLLDRTNWISQNNENELQVGDLRDHEGGEIRALRIGVIGALKFKKPWIYTVYGATNAFSIGFDSRETDSFSWLDYRLDIPVFNGRILSVGKQKEPISMERLMTLISIPFQERAAASDALMTSRNLGVVLSGTELDGRMSWAGGVFNDWLESGGSRSDGSTQFTGRITGLPLITADESNLLHLGIGYRYSNAEEGFTTANGPEINIAPDFIDIGTLLFPDRFSTWNAEISWRKGPMWLSSEYTRSDVANTMNGDLSFSGFNVSASWILTGEMRAYNRKSGTFGPVPIAKHANQGGWGAIEIGLRYSHTDLTDRTIFGGEMDVYSLAFNWWLQRNINFNINWRYVKLDKPAETGGPMLHGQTSGIISRVVLLLD